MPIVHIIFSLIVLAASYASYKTGKLTLAGAVTGGVVATLIYLGTGYIGIAMLAMFFLLSTLATSHKKSEKRKLTKEHSEKRDARQVLANGGLPAILGLLAFILPENAVLATILMAAAFASATADTLSSELGTVYGKRFYNIINFHPDEKGRDGVISIEGMLIGLAGSVIIAVIFALGFGLNSVFLSIIIAGTIGNLIDSVLGATLERRGYMGNNEINFLNTFFAVIACSLLIFL
ncbi:MULTISPECIES: DUF92 domain-containing protein [unclassified Mucilaginibacter]|uniref:DUF92 domain-containing protein n=1 Tax=unclassified Mucilaginibacter TaxID=2617802 RepID=UPI002AC95D2A|nr:MULTISPECIES: DUF92 domain-containing protein [unclassified Mucilaginibacter]MEB0261414.1 DUF92 domain-containing protein [Mucilaginibacter sp. 10I4]MEB0278827.1 DUF92 domain-containing protein [Mucilaginibacter sp. 10B2]MEB0299807.1 DUF92 domain-containing protein [Mucilaginibacter sp. 5C4]WPX22010.1 DUF92 domain-containing protein [Mucilaginibacter sp. 5C4]